VNKLAINGGEQAASSLKVPKWPFVTDEDRKAVLDVLDSGNWCRLFPGSQAERFENAFSHYHDAERAIAVNNGTVAIELALIAGGVRPGDEVLVPAVTFIASASAIVRMGAIPIFVDSDPETLSISPAAVEAAITPRTRAIIAVHYGGYSVDLDALLPIVKNHGLILIEDCAHAQGTEWRGRKVGSYGHFGTFSFQNSKALSSGEGGIVLVNDESLYRDAMLYGNIGRDWSKPGYEHHVLASNYRLPELSAALLLVQLSRLQEQVERRMRAASILLEGIKSIGGIQPLKPDARITQRGYYFVILRYSRAEFEDVPLSRFVKALQAEGVPCSSGYGIPLYKQPAFCREHVADLLGLANEEVPDYQNLHLDVAEHFCAEEQITILHPLLLAENDDMEMVLDAISKIKANVSELKQLA
jgi:dTDP-4-amino-4,6-dideoxygalactose transaminase